MYHPLYYTRLQGLFTTAQVLNASPYCFPIPIYSKVFNDESFTVYDHPKVMIFNKTASYRQNY